MPAAFTFQDDMYIDGLGRGTPLGSGFIRRVSLALTAGDLVGTLTPAEAGFGDFLGVISIVSRSAGITAQITTLSASSLTVTASASASTVDFIIHGRGI